MDSNRTLLITLAAVALVALGLYFITRQYSAPTTTATPPPTTTPAPPATPPAP